MKLALSIGAALACAAAPAAAQNRVTNGSFESGFSNWTVTQSSDPTTGGAGTAPVVIAYGQAGQYPTGAFGEAVPVDNAASASPDAAGGFAAYFSSDTGADTLTQAVNLVTGRTYRIGFNYYVPLNGANNPNPATLSFLIGGIPISALVGGSAVGTQPQRWFTFTTNYTATNTGPFSFQFRGGGSTAADFAVDRVYAIDAAVPEPATWGMMILGFGLVGAFMRRRRTTRTTAFA